MLADRRVELRVFGLGRGAFGPAPAARLDRFQVFLDSKIDNQRFSAVAVSAGDVLRLEAGLSEGEICSQLWERGPGPAAEYRPRDGVRVVLRRVIGVERLSFGKFALGRVRAALADRAGAVEFALGFGNVSKVKISG